MPKNSGFTRVSQEAIVEDDRRQLKARLVNNPDDFDRIVGKGSVVAVVFLILGPMALTMAMFFVISLHELEPADKITHIQYVLMGLSGLLATCALALLRELRGMQSNKERVPRRNLVDLIIDSLHSRTSRRDRDSEERQ